MTLPALAATASRVAAGVSRAAVSSSQIKSELQKARKRKDEDETQKASIPTSPAEQFKQSIAAARLFNAKKSMIGISDEESEEEKDLARAAMKKVIPRGAAFLANQIATALELSTAGTAFLLTWFIRFFTLGWLNVEMIYGRWIAKGKSKAVPPLAWDPIPMPIDKDAKVLQAVVIIADIFCLIMLLLPFILIIVIIAAVSNIVT